jgi:hypothetical protein
MDLGNAVRKIAIDLDVRITFDRMEISSRMKPLERQFAFALGTIAYPDIAEPGYILYIKPSYFGLTPIEVRAYAEANGVFPHEPTSDQWFGESQFESYRRLGEFLASALGGEDRSYQEGGLPAFFDDVRRQLMPPETARVPAL